MTDSIEIQPTSPIIAEIRPPGSKSITNRALVCAALAEGKSRLIGALDSEDTRVMVESLHRLGVLVEVDLNQNIIDVTGCGGSLPTGNVELFAANSGTTIRFLTALVALGSGTYRLDGVPRMRERPIGDLLEALNQLGANAISEAGTGCPPVIVRASGLKGGIASIRGNISSQFLSGLLMAVPYAKGDVKLQVAGTLVSVPYVTMTTAIMQAFGVQADASDLSRFTIPGGQHYVGREYAIEPDASAASYFWGAAAITGGKIKVLGLTRDALQGDVAFCECLAQMGCRVDYQIDGITIVGNNKLRGIEVNMNAISDTVQTLAVVALFAAGPTTITDVGHIRHKETDRIGDLARELRKLGATIEEQSDGLKIIPPEQPGGKLYGADLDTYRDHRMAMSLALAGLRIPGVRINDPGCTEKTYPHFFRDLASICR